MVIRVDLHIFVGEITGPDRRGGGAFSQINLHGKFTAFHQFRKFILRRSRIKPAAKGQGSVLQGIQKLQQYELIVDSSCFNLLEELENYSWKKDKSTGEYVNEPIDSYNHAIDALRYSLQCGEHKHRLKTLPKYSL